MFSYKNWTTNDSIRNKKFLSNFKEWNLKDAILLVMNGKFSINGLAASILKPHSAKVIIIVPEKMLHHILDEYIEQNKLWDVNIKENIEKIFYSIASLV